MTERQRLPSAGVIAALSTPVFLGVAPIFGKLAIQAGADAFSVAALRTLVSIALLWSIYAIFFRKYIYIYPAGLLGCVVVGVVNGIGSLFYYSSLSLIDASLGQLLNGMYLAFAVILSHMGGQKTDGWTLLRVGLATAAILILTGTGAEPVNWGGVGLMLGSALMFAGTFILSQYVLYEMPARTATLYILTTMAVIVSMVWLVVGHPPSPAVLEVSFGSIFVLGVTTALSRLAMFAGVKFMGGMQTAILAVAEIRVALLLAAVVLGERLTSAQWVGVAVLAVCILTIRQRDLLPRGYNPNALVIANMSSVQFQRIAFHRAFGTREDDDESGTMSAVTTQEILAIQRMMGARSGSIDPFPIRKGNQVLANLLSNEKTTPGDI